MLTLIFKVYMLTNAINSILQELFLKVLYLKIKTNLLQLTNE